MKFPAVDLLVHGSNPLLLASYSVRSVLSLIWYALGVLPAVISYYLMEFVSLVLARKWRGAFPGEQILIEGTPTVAVCIAIEGAVEVDRNRRHLGSLPPGHGMGSALALTGIMPSAVTASFVVPGRHIRWVLINLRNVLERAPYLREALQGVVNREPARKIEALVPIGQGVVLS